MDPAWRVTLRPDRRFTIKAIAIATLVYLAVSSLSVLLTWKMADGAAAQTTAASATFVGVTVAGVTLFNALLTRGMVDEMRLERETAELLRQEHRHGVLASFHAQLGRWHSSTSQGNPPHLPMSLDLYSASAAHLWRMWDEIRCHFVDIEPRIAALNSSPEGDFELRRRLARYIHEDLEPLRRDLRSYLFEYVVGCGKPGEDHTWRINYDQAVGHDHRTLQSEFKHTSCPTCSTPLEVRDRGADVGWRGADGAYHPRSELKEWPAGTVTPLAPGPSMV